jgi:hypothetical protein
MKGKGTKKKRAEPKGTEPKGRERNGRERKGTRGNGREREGRKEGQRQRKIEGWETEEKRNGQRSEDGSARTEIEQPRHGRHGRHGRKYRPLPNPPPCQPMLHRTPAHPRAPQGPGKVDLRSSAGGLDAVKGVLVSSVLP